MFKIHAKYSWAVHINNIYVHIQDLLRNTKMTKLIHSNLPWKPSFSQTARTDNLRPKVFVVNNLMSNRMEFGLEYSKY